MTLSAVDLIRAETVLGPVPFVPEYGVLELAHYEVPVRRELEDSGTRASFVWELSIPDDN